MAKSPDHQSNSLDSLNSVESKEGLGEKVKRIASKLITGGLARSVGVTAALAAAGCEIDDTSAKHSSDQRSVATMKAPLTAADFDKLDAPQKLDWMDGNPENINICPVGDKTYTFFVKKNTIAGGDLYYTDKCDGADACMPQTEEEIAAFKTSVRELPVIQDQYRAAGAIPDEANETQAKLFLSLGGGLLEQKAQINEDGTLQLLGQAQEFLAKDGGHVTAGDFSLVYVGGEPHIFWNVNEPHLLNLKTKEDILVNEGGLKMAGTPSMIDGGPVVASFKGGTEGNPTYNIYGGDSLETLVTDPTPLGINDGSKSNTNPRIHTFPDGSSAVFFEKQVSGVDQLHAAKFIPDEPVDGTDATDGTEGTDSTTGTTDVTDGTEGTDTTDTTDGTDTTDATDGTEGTDTTDATEGTDTTDATDGTEGTDTTDATEGTDVTDGTEGTDTTDATEGTDTTDVTDGTEGTDTTDSTDATDGTEGTDGNPDECQVYDADDFKTTVDGCEVKLCPNPEGGDFGQRKFEIQGENGVATCDVEIKVAGKPTPAKLSLTFNEGEVVFFTCDIAGEVIECRTPDDAKIASKRTDKDGQKLNWVWNTGTVTGTTGSLVDERMVPGSDGKRIIVTPYLKEDGKEYDYEIDSVGTGGERIINSLHVGPGTHAQDFPVDLVAGKVEEVIDFPDEGDKSPEKDVGSDIGTSQPEQEPEPDLGTVKPPEGGGGGGCATAEEVRNNEGTVLLALSAFAALFAARRKKRA